MRLGCQHAHMQESGRHVAVTFCSCWRGQLSGFSFFLCRFPWLVFCPMKVVGLQWSSIECPEKSIWKRSLINRRLDSSIQSLIYNEKYISKIWYKSYISKICVCVLSKYMMNLRWDSETLATLLVLSSTLRQVIASYSLFFVVVDLLSNSAFFFCSWKQSSPYKSGKD